jgi:uncharacterized OB-fold protein
VPLGGTGTIVSYTVIRMAPRGRGTLRDRVVKLDERVSLLGRAVDIPFDALKADLPVRFRPVEGEGQTIIGFGPA